MPDRALTPTEVESVPSELCPFCSGTNLRLMWGIVCRVRCLTCDARGPSATSESNAIAKWNARFDAERTHARRSFLRFTLADPS